MTDKEAKAFYNSSAWKHKRMQILDRDHYECQDCRKRIKDAAVSGTQLIGRDRKIWRAEEVHHIQGLKEHPELGLDDDNLVNLVAESLRLDTHTSSIHLPWKELKAILKLDGVNITDQCWNMERERWL